MASINLPAACASFTAFLSSASPESACIPPGMGSSLPVGTTLQALGSSG